MSSSDFSRRKVNRLKWTGTTGQPATTIGGRYNW